MATINVVHRSRTVEYTINFTANGVTSWSFVADGDGVFFQDALTNVASYTINGQAPTMPFLVVSGTRYTIAITKTTAAQVASVRLTQRRSTNKTTTLAAPDFGQYNGRYIYALMNSGTEVRKIDTNLLLASNYVGAGVWTTNPVVATITLPTIPGGAVWTSLTFVKQGDIPRMILHTSDADSSQAHFCVIRLSDDLVFDVTLTTQNSYTTHTNINVANPAVGAIYDFVNEIVYFGFAASGSQFRTVISLNLTTNVFTNYQFNSFTQIRVSEIALLIRGSKFIPDLQRWSSVGDFSLIEGRYFNYKPAVNAGEMSGYQLSRGTTDRTQGSLNAKDLLDSSGRLVVRLSTSPISEFGTDETYTMDSAGYIFSCEDDDYIFHDYQNASPTHKAGVGANFDGTTNGYRSLIGSNLNAHFYARTAQGNTPGQRIIVFNPALATPEFAYLDLGEAINQLHTNQLVI